MNMKERMKRVFSILLCLCMVLTLVPTTAFAVDAAEGGSCEHHTAHTAECGYAAAVEAHECHYECAECAAAAVSEEPSEESSEPAPVCDCGTDDALIHAVNCAVYVAPENPQCFCAEKCSDINIWCDVCGFDYTACTGTDRAVGYSGYELEDGNLALGSFIISISGEDAGVKYQVLTMPDNGENGTVSVCGHNGVSGDITIPGILYIQTTPGSMFGFIVTAIEEKAFQDCSDLTSVMVRYSGDTVSVWDARITIGDGAFKGTQVSCATHRFMHSAACDVCDYVCGHAPSENAFYSVNDDVTHSYTCTICGHIVTEAHTIIPETGRCICSLDLAVAYVKTDSAKIYFDTVENALAACKESDDSRLMLLKETDELVLDFMSALHRVTLSVGSNAPIGKITVKGEVALVILDETEVSGIHLENGQLVLEFITLENFHKCTVTASGTGTDLTVHVPSGYIVCDKAGNVFTVYGNSQKIEALVHSNKFSVDNHDWTGVQTSHVLSCPIEGCGVTVRRDYSYDLESKNCLICGARQPYAITVNPSKNGTVTADKFYAYESELITLTVNPDVGYAAKSLEVFYQIHDGAEEASIADHTITPTPVADQPGKYTFTMPAANVYVNAAFAVCDHSESEHTTATDRGDGTHSFTCTVCRTTAAEDHTPAYTANGNIITASCSANCGYSETATISAKNATYSGTSQETATVAYSDGWTGGELTVSYEDNVNAGTATASITIEGKTANVDFTIEKADPILTPPVAKIALIYDGTAKTLIIPGGTTGGTLMYRVDDSEWSDTAPTATNAGRYTVSYKVDGDKNYNDVAEKSFTVVIVKGNAPSITFPTVLNTITYGQPLKEAKLSFYENEYGTFNWLASIGVPNAGTGDYALDFYPSEAALNNYEWKDTEDAQWIESRNALCDMGRVTVNKAPVTHTGTDAVRTYDGEPIDMRELFALDENAGEASWWMLPITGDGTFCQNPWQYLVTKVGTFQVTVKTEATDNYAAGEFTVNLTVEKATATETTAPTPQTLTYTGEAQNLISGGEAEGGTMHYSTDNQNWSTTIPQGTAAGEYTVYYKVVGDANHSDTAVDSIEVTIAKADPVIGTVGCEMDLYDSTAISNVELTRTDMSVEGTLVLTDSELTAGEGTYNWKFTPKDTDNYNTIAGTVVLTVTADVLEKIEASGTLEKGSYSYGDTFSIDGLTVTATYTTGATKDVTELVSFDNTLAAGQPYVELTYQGKTCTVTGFTVAKKQLIIDRMAWDIPENAVYSGTAYNATLTGNLPEGVTVTKTGDTATNAGDYTAKAVFSLAEGYSADNYEIVNGEDLTADWTIAKKNIAGATITLGTAQTYNGKQQTQAVTKVEIDGLTVTYTVSGNTGTDAKGYTLTVTGNGNFEGTETKEWSIAKKNISGATITLGDSLTYNGNERTQEVTDVKIGDLTVTYDVTANKQLGAGNYTLTVTGNGNFEGSATADWSIAKAKLTITANNNSITYGDVPAANGVTGTGFVSSESIEDLPGELTYSYNYEQFGNVGTYKITPSGVTSNNYEITFADGTLTVNAKAITVTADAVSKTYGEADPTLTYTAQGLVNGDELTGELKRAAGENVGDYAIEQNTLTAGNNYRLTYSGAKLTINAKAITAADVKLNGSLTYNGKEQTQPITITEGITYEVTGNKATNVGTYELIVEGTGNYTGSVTLDWTIAKAKLTITADSKVIYIGEKLPTLTYTTSGLVGGDKLTKEPVLTTNADADQVSSYTITAANADAGDNYTITYVSASLTIMDKETEVETKIEQTKLTEVPDGLKNTQFDTVEEIKEELISKILATYTGYSGSNMVHYDVTLHFSLDGGDSWILATEQNFPTEGIAVILPYPEGTNARDYEFVVSHMFTVTSQRLGTVAGEVEMPKVEETANGIRVTLNGLSPVTVAARYHDHTGGTATCTDKTICSICGTAYGELDATNHAGGTEVKNAKEATCGAEGYTGDTHCKGCGEIVGKGTAIKATGEHTYGDWKVVKEPTKTTKGEKQRTCSACGHVDSKEIPVLSDTPATGDDSNIILYGSMFTVSLAGLVVLLLAAKKRKQENA